MKCQSGVAFSRVVFTNPSMIDGLGITEHALAAYLAKNIAGFCDLQQVKKFTGGQSNPTYQISAASGEYVLRAKPPGKLLRSAHLVEREYRVMAALAHTDVAVPQMLHLAPDDSSPIGRAFFVMEYLDGRVLWDPALPDVTRAERTAIYDAMNTTLATLHSVDPLAVGLADFGKPGNYFARQMERWAQQYRASVSTDHPEMEHLIKYLSENMPVDDGQIALVHGDFRLDNMMFATHQPNVLGLLDWELATLGHPLADLAYQCMQWRLPHDAGMRGLGGLDRSTLGLPEEGDYIAAYCACRGISVPKNWSFYLGFAFFRLAAILEGVVRRAKDGNASNPKAALAYESAIPVLVALALDVIGEE